VYVRGVVKFRSFCRVLGTLGYEGDVMLLWQALQASGQGLVMDAVDAASAEKLAALGEWCQLHCGGILEAFTQLDLPGTGNLTTSQLLKGLRDLGFFVAAEGRLPSSEDGFVKELLPLLDPWGHDSVLAEDFFVCEPDANLRSALRDRLERHRARNDRGGTPAGDVKAHQTAARASWEESSAASRCTSRANTPVAALFPPEGSVAGLSSPSRENESMKLLCNLAKHNTALGGKHWKSSEALAVPREKRPGVRKPSSKGLSPARPPRSSSLPELSKAPSPVQEAAAAMEAAHLAETAAEAGKALEQCRKQKKKMKQLYGQKQFEKNLEAGFLPKLPPKISEAAGAPVPLWNSGARRRVPGLVRQGKDRELFARYEGH